MNLREIACKKLTEQLLEDCAVEYRRMYHNGSLRGNWPDFENDREYQAFWDTLQEDEVEDLKRNLADDILEEFGLEMKIHQFGHGATFAPADYSNSNGCGYHFNSTLDPDMIVDTWRLPDPMLEGEDFGEWTEAYETAKNHLAAFRLINERVRAAASTDLAEWWKEMKAGNEWTFNDEDEDDDDDDNLIAEAAG